MKTGFLKRLNAADWISSIRLLVIPFVIVTTVMNLKLLTGWIIFLALCSDFVDGQVARRFKLSSDFGAKLDSIADASLFIAAFCSLVWFFNGFIMAHLWQVSLLMGLYLFQLVFSLVRFKRVTSYHTYAAKLAALAEGLFIAVCFFYQPVEWLFYIVWLIGLVEQADEITLMFLLPKLRENVKGVYWVLKEKV